MTNSTQKQIVINRLLDMGGISRNWALKNYISRLSAHILELKKEGWEFETKRYNGNYIYLVTYCPLQAIEYRLGDRIILKYERKTEN